MFLPVAVTLAPVRATGPPVATGTTDSNRIPSPGGRLGLIDMRRTHEPGGQETRPQTRASRDTADFRSRGPHRLSTGHGMPGTVDTREVNG